MQPGSGDNKTWVNGVLTVGVCDVRQGRTAYECTLFDPENPQIAVAARFPGRQSFPFEGAVVVLTGQGMSFGEYKGKVELSCGQKIVVSPVGQPSAQPSPQPYQQAPAPAYQPQGLPQGAQRVQGVPLAQGTAPMARPAVSSQAEDIALGRAMNNAVALFIAAHKQEGGGLDLDLDNDALKVSQELYLIASDLLSVERAVRSRPAPTPKQRAGGMTPGVQQPQAPAPVEAPQPPPPAPAPVARAATDATGAAYPQAPAAGPDDMDDIPF